MLSLSDTYLTPLVNGAEKVGLDHSKWSYTPFNRTNHFNSALILFTPGRDIRIHIRMVSEYKGKEGEVLCSGEMVVLRMTAAIKKRTRGGGYANLESIRFSSSAMDPNDNNIVFQKEICKLFTAYVKHVKQSEIKGVPKALTFKDTDIVHSGVFLRNTSQIAYCKVLRLVNIRDLTFIEILDSHALSTPGVKPWFLIECGGFQGACFNIITDGDVFHPSTRVTATMLSAQSAIAQPAHMRAQRVRIVANCDKATVDLTETTASDKRLINEAIEMWVEHFA